MKNWIPYEYKSSPEVLALSDEQWEMWEPDNGYDEEDRLISMIDGDYYEDEEPNVSEERAAALFSLAKRYLSKHELDTIMQRMTPDNPEEEYYRTYRDIDNGKFFTHNYRKVQSVLQKLSKRFTLADVDKEVQRLRKRKGK